MKTFTLERIRANAFATYGRWVDETHAQIAVTLEPPGAQRIPAGTYTLRRRSSKAHRCELFGIEGVPDRSDIEVHPGDLPRDTKGCVLLGTTFGFVDYADGRPGASGYGVTASRPAFDRFMNLMDGENTAVLTVLDVAPAVA